MIDSKRLFDEIRGIKGSALTQADVDRINAVIAPLATPPSEPPLPANPKIPADIATGARASEKATGIPASVTLAQWALESGWGKSVSGKNNYGGITAKVKDAAFPTNPGTPLEDATLCWTHEVVKGQLVKCQRWFKNFATVGEFFDAHGRLLSTAPIYAKARAELPDVDAFVDAMGPIYATAPTYAATIKSIMRSNNLYAYNVVQDGTRAA
jgi:flagellum-specific peptidoglycan hydrolase FlgJ